MNKRNRIYIANVAFYFLNFWKSVQCWHLCPWKDRCFCCEFSTKLSSWLTTTWHPESSRIFYYLSLCASQMQYTGEKQNFPVLQHWPDFQNSHNLGIWSRKGKISHFSPVILFLVLVNRFRLHMQIRWPTTESIFLDCPDLIHVYSGNITCPYCVLYKPLKCVFNLFQTRELKVLEGPHYWPFS